MFQQLRFERHTEASLPASNVRSGNMKALLKILSRKQFKGGKEHIFLRMSALIYILKLMSIFIKL